METRLFPGYRGHRHNLRLATPLPVARKAWYQIRNVLRKKHTTLCSMRDVFGGIGIDAIIASRALDITVFVTECDLVTFQCLCRNIIYQGASRVIADRRDGREQPFLTELVYLDPPWGNDYLPGRPFDFFGVFGELIQSEARWCRFLIVKTPFFLGATRAPWKPIYAYCSRKYRIIMWVFDVTSEGNKRDGA